MTVALSEIVGQMSCVEGGCSVGYLRKLVSMKSPLVCLMVQLNQLLNSSACLLGQWTSTFGDLCQCSPHST